MLCTPGQCQHVSPGAGLSARGNRQARRTAPQHEPERTAGSGWSPPKSGLQESDQQDRNPAAERDKGVCEPSTEDREHRNSEAADRYRTDCQEPLSWCQLRHLEPLRRMFCGPIAWNGNRRHKAEEVLAFWCPAGVPPNYSHWGCASPTFSWCCPTIPMPSWPPGPCAGKDKGIGDPGTAGQVVWLGSLLFLKDWLEFIGAGHPQLCLRSCVQTSVRSLERCLPPVTWLQYKHQFWEEGQYLDVHLLMISRSHCPSPMGTGRLGFRAAPAPWVQMVGARTFLLEFTLISNFLMHGDLLLVYISFLGLLWNLSSTDELKEELIQEALPVLTDCVIIPFSGWSDGGCNRTREIIDPEVFFNATGCLRWVIKQGLSVACHVLTRAEST